MPRTTNDCISTTSVRRRSARVRKTVNIVTDYEEEDVQQKKMPPGYNPSDDSEDEYIPPSKSRKMSIVSTSSRRRRKDESEDSSDSEAQTPAKRRKITAKKSSTTVSEKKFFSATPAKQRQISPKTAQYVSNSGQSEIKISSSQVTEKVTVKKEPATKIECPFEGCQEEIKIKIRHSDASFHIACHYYDERVPLEKLRPSDQDDDGSGWSKDDKEKNYTCDVEKCTRRRMGYREMYVHNCTQHRQLENLMAADSSDKVKVAMLQMYPREEPDQAVQQKPAVKNEPLENENEDPDDPDDPEDHDDPEDPDDPPPLTKSKSSPPKPRATAPKPTRSPPKPAASPPKPAASVSRSAAIASISVTMSCLICNGQGRSSKEGRNLNTNSSDMRSHISICVYHEGGFIKYLDPRQGKERRKLQGNKEEKIDEMGENWKYRCPFDDCEKNKGKVKPEGYKAISIHMGADHNVLELWARDQTMEGAKRLYEILKNNREAAGKELQDLPELRVEEFHTCLVCRGEDKEGKALSMDRDKINNVRYHYACCLYDTGLYFSRYPIGPENELEDGTPEDFLGKVVKYSCEEKGCKATEKRKFGYKEFTIHMAKDHGGLEEIMENHEDEEFRNIMMRIKKIRNG